MKIFHKQTKEQGSERAEMKRTITLKYALDFVIISVSLIALASMINYARPLVVAPIGEFESANTSVVFSFEKGTAILLDDNRDFTTPERVEMKNAAIVNLAPGTYYWKVDGLIDSPIRQLTIKSQVGLTLRETTESYEVINSGNVDLNVDVYEGGAYVRTLRISPDNSESTTGEKFVGRQDHA